MKNLQLHMKKYWTISEMRTSANFQILSWEWYSQNNMNSVPQQKIVKLWVKLVHSLPF